MKHFIFCLSLVLFSTQLPAQVLQNIKKMAEDKAKKVTSKENLDKVGNALMKDLDKARAEFDSTDFDYAILLSDNSGLFDVKEKGEFSAKFSTWANIGSSMYKKDELTDAEQARFNLEMGELAYASGKYNYADKRLNTAKLQYEEGGLTDDIGYIKSLADLGLLYATMGRFTQAESFTQEALDLRKEKLGDANIGVASSLNNYGVLHYNLARYNEAEKNLSQALSIIESNNARETMPYAIALNNQAMLYQTIGRYNEAEEVLKKAIAIGEKLQSKKSRNHLKFISNLALLYQQMGRYSDAEAIYLGMEKRLGKNDPDYASMLNNLAALYMITGKEDKVEEPLKKSISIYKASFGEDNPAFAKSTSDLGNFYRYKERYSDAQPLLERALSIREKTLGVNHPSYVQSQEDLSILYWKKKNWDVAYMRYREVMDKSVEFINRYFPPMSEAEKTKYWDVLSPRFHRFENFAVECQLENKHVLEDMFDYQLVVKALLLNSTNRIKQTIFSSDNAELVRDYSSWLDLKERLARLYAYSKDELKSQKINLDSLERSANQMERQLSERSVDFQKGYVTEKTSYKQVQALLGETDALVDIIRIRNYQQSFNDEVKYAALILKKETELPVLVVLPNGQQLETRYAKFYKNAIHQRIADEYSYDQYWAALEPELKGMKVIYLSPDGVFNQINLNTLRRGESEYFINRYDLAILGNAKDLIDIKKRKSSTASKTAVLAGFPDYGGGDVAALPGTKAEIEGVTKVLKTSGYQVTSFMQSSATESNIKKTKSPALMHVATHGYFLADVDNLGGTTFGVNLENASDNPLLRSGLLFAGASKTAMGATPDLESNDNGVLTAYEAMNLNLQGTDLVILSACETGLGEVKSGEGVYGLQRAFLVAGAEAIIMSLWKVDDAATQALMTNFYTNWLKTRDKQKAFKQAQLQLMTKYKEPYYWGAFVMMGL